MRALNFLQPIYPGKCSIRCLALFTALLLLPLTAFCQISGSVRVKEGQLSGVKGSDPSVMVFRGIPYAAPPVGDLRWRAPQPPTAWQGVRPADTYSAGCIQDLARSRAPWTAEFMHQGEASEDCLYLNVWTAAKTAREKRPVLVYIHGGGFNEGSGSVAVYDGEELAKKGLVVVTINYRVGLLGFLAHPELTAESGRKASGNYGLLDQVAALQWVQRNIGAFGGDPHNVTIAGQSAGAMSVYLLTASPLAKGLFHRAISQSGPGGLASFGVSSARTLTRPLSDAEAEGAAFAKSKGASSIRDLRALSVAELVAPLPGGARAPRSGVVLDGYFLTDNPAGVYASGRQNDVPMLTGFNADEPSAFPGYGSMPTPRKDSLRNVAAAALQQLVAGRVPGGKTNAYLYYFERGIPWPERPEFGAFHTAEVPYVFNNLKQIDRPWEAVDRKLADVVSSYWVNFATKGDPNGPGLPHWPSFREDPHAFMVLGEQIGARKMPAN